MLHKMYLPHRNASHVKPAAYESYEGFYMDGAVKLCGEVDIKSLKDIVVENKSL